MNDALLTLSVSDESTSSAPAKATPSLLFAPVFPKKKILPTADLENMMVGQTTEQLVQQFEEDSPSAMAGKTPLEFLYNLSDKDAILFGPTTDPDGAECDAKVIQVNVPKLQQVISSNTTNAEAVSGSPETEVPVKTDIATDIDAEDDLGRAQVSSNLPGRVPRPLIGNITKNSSVKKKPCQNRSFTFGGPGWCSPNVGKKFASEDVRVREQELRKAKNAQAQKKADAQAKSIEREKGYDKSEAFDSHRDCQVGFGSISGQRGPLPPPAILPSLARSSRVPLVRDTPAPALSTVPAPAPAPTIEDQLKDPQDLDPVPYVLTYQHPDLKVDEICGLEADFATKWDPTVGVFHQTSKSIFHLSDYPMHYIM